MSSPGVVVLDVPFPDRFYFDGDSVVMSLWTLKAWVWRTPDDIYRLRARWKGADLQVLPPFADWLTLATFRDGRFQETADGGPVVFERITERDLDDNDRLLLKPREKHDYRRQMDGTLGNAD